MKGFYLLPVCFCGLFFLTSCGGGSASGPVFPALVITSAAPPAGVVQAAYGPGGSGFSLTASGGESPYTWTWADAVGSSLPPGLSFANGAISGVPTTAGSYNVIVTVIDSQSPPRQKSANYTIPVSIGTLTVTSSAPPAGTVGTAYAFSFTASGGITPYTWSWAAASGSSLPPGLSVTSGSISGTPTAAGSYNLIVTITDSESPAVQMSANYTIVISPPTPLAITSGTPPSGTVGARYAPRRRGSGFVLLATGGITPYTWNWTAEAGSTLPPGLNIVGSLITGIPTTPGTYNVVVTVMDSSTPAMSVSANYSITINPPPQPVVNTTAPPNGAINLPFTFTFTATQGYAPLTWSETGALPGGLVLSTAGVLSGTPTATGQFPITVTAQDQFGQAGSQGFTVQIFANGFKVTGSMGTPRVNHTATLLNSGKVLITGGFDNNNNVLATAELFDPSTGTFSSTGSMGTARRSHTATLLANGKVLVAGGCDSLGNCLTSAELYDPVAGSFAATGSLGTARGAHTATLLQNGKVLIAGGENFATTTSTASAELYDPASGTFSSTGALGTARNGHTATLLASGKVLMAGGANGIALASAELYDPTAGTFSATGSMSTTRLGLTASLLGNGQVLVAGGADVNGNHLATAELFDPNAGTFALTSGSMITGRFLHTSTLLSNGNVLIAGGVGSNALSLNAAELFDPSTSTFSGTGSLNTARWGHTATLLNNGTVLVIGGGSFGSTLASAELYQ